jgi:predicted nucleotidyltransferase
MHFYESSIITTKDGLHCQVYGNEHPKDEILVKPKYIPTDKISSDALQYRFITSKKMNRLNLWADKQALTLYLQQFQEAYPNYVYNSPLHENGQMQFAVPIDNIERIYFPRRGLKELMSMPENSLDEHLMRVHQFVNLVLQSGLRLKDLGVTYSTLMGHYMSSISDINIVVYGKDNFWKLMQFFETAEHNKLRWKTADDWQKFLENRDRFTRFGTENAIRCMMRKKSEGYFDNTLFVIFAAEKEEEVWFKWGAEKYKQLGLVTVEGTVGNNRSSVVRPGCYELSDGKAGDVPIKKIVFYNRDYCMLAKNGERIQASGILEEVTPQNGEKYHRVVLGYFDAYTSDRREKEFMRVL